MGSPSFSRVCDNSRKYSINLIHILFGDYFRNRSRTGQGIRYLREFYQRSNIGKHSVVTINNSYAEEHAHHSIRECKVNEKIELPRISFENISSLSRTVSEKAPITDITYD